MMWMKRNSPLSAHTTRRKEHAFLRKKVEDGECKVSAVSASEILKRNTDSIRNAVENDVFGSLPDDSLLDELELGWGDE